MPTITRRFFLLSTAALPIGCTISRRQPELTAPSPTVRQPVVGQSWRYAKHDLFTGALVDIQDEQIASVDRAVEINSRTESEKDEHAARPGSLNWIRKYFDHPRTGGPLPSEVQDPWGMVLVDPHWSQVQVYETPIPLWPTQLQPGWQTHIKSKYKTSDEAGLPWAQTMKAEAWESITVPAGQFKALRYINDINFTSSDLSRANSVRRETIWFAPEIGRWVARESRGTYYFDESVADDQYNESSYRWELLGFT
ncbi:MAG: hypothetical protein ABSG18_26655 [Steroidobacteraceae bacterium]|jgi:hypothetical protein